MSGATRKPNVRWECTMANTTLRNLIHESGVAVPWQSTGEGSTRKAAWDAAKANAVMAAQRVPINLMTSSVPGQSWLTWFNLYHECHLQTLSDKPFAEWTAMNPTGQKVTLKRIYTRRNL